jgi:hypothetical protein
MLIDMIIKNLARLIAYVSTSYVRVPRVDERTTEGFDWDEMSIDISGDAARVILYLGSSNRLTDKQAALQPYRVNLTTVERVLESPPSG